MLALGIWFGLTGSAGNISRFAQISTVLLSIPVFIASLVFGLVLVGLIYLVGRLLRGIPPVAERLLHFLDRIRDTAERGSRSVAKLVIEPAARLAVFQRKSDRPVEEIKLND